jgi:hypothetical protein
MPELRAIHNLSTRKPKVQFFEGVEGIKEIYSDTLKVKRPIIGWSDYEQMRQVLGEPYFEVYPPERARKNISFKTILTPSDFAEKQVSKDYGLLRETKYLPEGALATEINIYGNKVALMSFRKDNPISVLIEDDAISNSLRTIWEQQWDSL